MKIRVLLCVFVFLVSFKAQHAAAQTTYTWAGAASGNWAQASNWRVNGNPTVFYPGQSASNDIAVINTSNALVTFTGTLTIGSLQSTMYGISGLGIKFSGATPSLTITGGLNMAQPSAAAVSIAFSGTGTATISGTSSFQYQGAMSVGVGTSLIFSANSILDFTTNQAALTNSGSISFLSGSNFKMGDFTSLLNSGTITGTSATFTLSGSGSPACVVNNSGIFKATSSTFTISGSNAGIINSGAFTTKTCTYTITNSGSVYTRINNTGTYIDHGSVISMNSSGGYILNSGSPGNMHLSGTSITTTGTTSGVNNSASFTADSAASFNLNAYQDYITNTGTFIAGSTSSACIITLGAQAASVSSNNIFKLGPASIIYPTAIYTTITNTSPGVFTLQSDVNSTAAIGALTSTSLCVGIFNVERYLSGGTTKDATTGRWIYRNYRLISSPVNTISSNTGSANVFPVSFKYLANSAIITGTKGGYAPPNTFNSATAVGNPSLYLFREDITPSNQSFTSGDFIGITDITDQTNYNIGTSGGTNSPVSVGNGVQFFYRGDNIHFIGTSPGKTKAPYVAVEASTFTATGYINQGSYQVQNWVTGGGSLKYETSPTYNSVAQNNVAVRGYNLVGNPYPCSINWDTFNDGSNGITFTSVNPTIYVFNPVTNQYNTYLAGNHGVGTGPGAVNTTNANIIVSGQGFYVQANNHAATLTFNENAKLATAQVAASNLLLGTPVVNNNPLQYLRLTLIKDSINTNDMLMFFKSAADINYSGQEDSKYLPGNGPQVSLASYSADSVQLAINTLPFPKLQASVTRLNVNVSASGQYTLSRGELQSIPAIYEVWLMDAYKKDSLDIRNNSNYVFNIDNTDAASYGAGRFTIVIRQNAALGIHLLNFAATKVSGGSQTVWKTENEQSYSNFTVERSTDNGVTYTVLGGFLSGAQGTYSFLDKSPASGIDLYRLKIEDLNGTVTYSQVIPLSYTTINGITANNISVYPNPASSIINLSINQNNSAATNLSALQSLGQTPSLANSNTTASFVIKVINITGYVVKTATATQPTWQDNVGSLQPGTYVIQVTNKNDNSLVGKSTFVKL